MRMSTVNAALNRKPELSPAPGRTENTEAWPRFMLPLAALVFVAMLSCLLLGYLWARQTEALRETEQRLALRDAVEESRSEFLGNAGPDPATMRAVERATGLKELRFESKPAAGRETQTVVDPHGRILGWLSWDAERPTMAILQKLWPLIAVTLFGFVVLMTAVLWRVRRTAQALASNLARARKLAEEDPLTGLPHHRTVLTLLERAIAKRRAPEVAAFVHIGLDHFTEINDSIGHMTADELLAAIGERLRSVLPKGSFAGRFGGDEFAVYAIESDEQRAIAAAEAIAAVVTRPYWVGNRPVQAGASGGVVLITRDGADSDEIARRANVALKFAKEKKRGRVVVFDPAMDEDYSNRRFIERELRHALASDQLTLHYQPIVAANGSTLLGFEALLRWIHPQRGQIPPLAFVSVAEQTGMMGELGHFVLKRALADAQRWPSLSIAVNLSPVQVRDPALVDIVLQELKTSHTRPDRLILEVTEGVLIDNPAEAKERLDAVRALGVKLALDDFGTGYSSLSYLQNFHFDKLKIDKSFVRPIGRSGGSPAMIQAIVGLGRALGMSILVEGVETEEQRVLLRLAGCDEMQGFLFSHPLPREEVDQFLRGAREMGTVARLARA